MERTVPILRIATNHLPVALARSGREASTLSRSMSPGSAFARWQHPFTGWLRRLEGALSNHCPVNPSGLPLRVLEDVLDRERSRW